MTPAPFLFYSGPSQLGRSPIIGIVTFGSENPKTGPMAQVWILARDQAPLAVLGTAVERAICGSCPLSGSMQTRACYVTVRNAPLTIWRKYRVGGYAQLSYAEAQQRLAGQRVRLGAYGDPTAIPRSVWKTILAQADAWTGYTHAWRQPRMARYRDLLMASVETATDARRAWRQGWRTFRVSPGGPSGQEISCPASEEMGKRTTCYQCRLCDGASPRRDGVKSIVIRPHGALAGRYWDAASV